MLEFSIKEQSKAHRLLDSYSFTVVIISTSLHPVMLFFISNTAL